MSVCHRLTVEWRQRTDLVVLCAHH